jgi:hypothetical protein
MQQLLITCRANLEYSITEDERILAHFGNRTTLLEETLNSHRHATSLNPSNTDILFNTAQVLTSLAEAGMEAGTPDVARDLLEEAVDIFTRCLDKQQNEYQQMQAEIAKAQASGEYQEAWSGDRPQPAESEQDMEAASASSEAGGDWATVEEPLTPENILETCTAQLGALTTLLGLYSSEDLASIEKKAQDGLDTASGKIPALVSIIDASPQSEVEDEPKAGPTLSLGSSAETEASTTPKDDAVLAAANFQASLAEAMFRSGRTMTSQYAQAVEETFAGLIKQSERTNNSDLAAANIKSAYADALIDLASSLSDSIQYVPSAPTFISDLEIQWVALSQAQKSLTELSAAPYASLLSAARLADIYLARGDAELFRFRIALTPGAKPAWASSKAVVVANAGVFYRGARSYAERAGAMDVRGTADAKAIVAEILKEVASGSQAGKEHWKGRSEDVAIVLAQMVEEGVVGEENAEGVLGWTE